MAINCYCDSASDGGGQVCGISLNWGLSYWITDAISKRLRNGWLITRVKASPLAGAELELEMGSGDREVLGQAVNQGRLLESLLNDFFGQTGALATLTGNPQRAAQAPEGSGALIDGRLDLMIGDAFAETDVHD